MRNDNITHHSSNSINKEVMKLKIIIKPDSDDEDPNKLYNLLRNGLSGQYVLQSVTKDKFKANISLTLKKKARNNIKLFYTQAERL